MYIRLFALTGLSLMMGAYVMGQESRAIPRTPDGRPDLTGMYDANTITPVERPAQFGDRRALTEKEAADLVRTQEAVPRRPGSRAMPIGRRPLAAATSGAITTSGWAVATASSV